MNSSQCNISPTTGAAAQLFSSTVKLIAAAQCCFPNEWREDQVDDESHFDFIIVGAGSAGSVVANRLSEVSGWNILVLEAGSEPPVESFIPNLEPTLLNSKYDWNYTTLNNYRTSQAIINGEVMWSRGKMLGGSSMINNMFYVKGRKEDYQSWFEEGNPSWSPENIEPFEKKLESLQNVLLKNSPLIRKNYGDKGPQVINQFNMTYRELNDKILESWNTMGFKQVIDVNSAEFKSPGFCSRAVFTAANGMRYGTYNSYILPAHNRNNLKVITDAFVTKILINENLEAYGVEIDINNKRKKLFASKEVIVCAGSINTPQLLMLSGIGPKRHLRSKNISCKVNLPAVGKNLQDHVSVMVPIYGDITGLETQLEPERDVPAYCYNRTGVLADNIISDIFAFYSRQTKFNYPEFQSHLRIIKGGKNSNFPNFRRFNKDAFESLKEFSINKTFYAFELQLLHPYSRGTIKLNTSDPYDKPVIDANYFGDRRDLKLIADGIMMLTKIVNTEFFETTNAFVHRIKIPECLKIIFNTKAYWKCYSKNVAGTIYHPTGTTKMGPNPRNSVVNNFLQVHGVRNLRVIDAGIMPTITSGNTNAPTLMIGEMGASMIKKYYNLK